MTRTNTVGERIVQARRRAGISQERLAERIGTSRRHMIRLEKGVHRPGKVFIERIAEATGQDESFFTVDGDEDDDDSDPVSLLSSITLADLLRVIAFGHEEQRKKTAVA